MPSVATGCCVSLVVENDIQASSCFSVDHTIMGFTPINYDLIMPRQSYTLMYFLPLAVEDKKVFEFSDYFFGMIIEQSEVRYLKIQMPSRKSTWLWLDLKCDMTLLTLSVHARQGYSSCPVCLSVCLSVRFLYSAFPCF